MGIRFPICRSTSIAQVEPLGPRGLRQPIVEDHEADGKPGSLPEVQAGRKLKRVAGPQPMTKEQRPGSSGDVRGQNRLVATTPSENTARTRELLQDGFVGVSRESQGALAAGMKSIQSETAQTPGTSSPSSRPR
jgi:hypothetical protein